jgi:hypothetical protein
MSLSLKDSRSIADLAELLYDFLPGSGNASWVGHVSFRSVADEVGVGHFWQQGSKTPMIVALLSRTLERQRDKFEPLILQIIRCGITYRQKNRNPITSREIDQINGMLLELGFKFPDLWDLGFKDALRFDRGERAKEHVADAINEQKARSSEQTERSKALADLQREFIDLYGALDRQDAGLKLEVILNRLFDLHGLGPREPFRVTGEQIDGSFDLDHETYLLEAKWEKSKTPESQLLVFCGKIEGKSLFTRGVFVSINGLSEPAKVAITTGKQPSFFAIDGHDITMLLSDNIGLVSFLRRRRRLLAEKGAITVPFSEVLATEAISPSPNRVSGL